MLDDEQALDVSNQIVDLAKQLVDHEQGEIDDWESEDEDMPHASPQPPGGVLRDAAVTDSLSTLGDQMTAIEEFQSVTVTVADEAAEEKEMPQSPQSFEGILGIEGKATSDGRYLMPGEISERDLPLPLMVQTKTEEGHKGAELGGKITDIWRQENGEVTEIWGRGVFDEGEVGQEAARLLDAEFLNGVSLDVEITEAVPLDPETYEPIDLQDFDLMQMLTGNFIKGVKGKIMGATLVPFPAFEEGSLHTVSASGKSMSVLTSASFQPVEMSMLTASALGLAPLKPPSAWFEMPELNHATPLTVTEDGQVYGHIATWGACHTGVTGVCQRPPRSKSGYKFFHLGEIETEDGDPVAVGRITVGTSHAGPKASIYETIRHYDDSGTVAAFVRAKDGKHGIWVSGAVRSDLAAEKVRDLRANPPSGDWRADKGHLELRGILAVPMPGFPVPRTEARLVASGDTLEVEALVASGFAPTRKEEEEMQSREDYRQKVLLADARAELAWERDGLAYNAADRRRMAKSGEALPDGSFPIANCGDAENAIHAQGRATSQPRAVAHIKKRVRALGCTGDIFDNYK